MTELRQLRYFVTVAEEGQMTRAASKLHLAQPALSQAIAKLESQLGIELFARDARGMTLTPAGEAFLGKARTAIAAVADADLAARAQSRADTERVEWGFIASPPMAQAPDLFAAFSAAHPDVKFSFRELSFPRGTTAAWLEAVDVALCFSPTPHPDVRIHPLRAEARVVVAAKTHPLAQRGELMVADVLDETFCGEHPTMEPVRAAFWRLDDYRGGPGRTTADEALNPLEMIAVIARGHAITTAPASSATQVLASVPDVVALPLRDASPTVLALVWHKDTRNPLVDAIVAGARRLYNSGPERA